MNMQVINKREYEIDNGIDLTYEQAECEMLWAGCVIDLGSAYVGFECAEDYQQWQQES